MLSIIGLSFLFFITVTLIIFIIGKFVSKEKTVIQLRKKIVTSTISSKNLNLDPKVLSKITPILESLSKLSLPEDGWQNSTLKLKFVRAGISYPDAAKIFYGVKTILAFVVPILFFVSLWKFSSNIKLVSIFFYTLLITLIGYYSPELYLRRRIKNRIREMQEALPDIIDLLVICTDSGMGLDAAISRVASEAARGSPHLAKEFYLTGLEIRAGAGRALALKNMALRTNLDDLQNFVSMLVQADKFGTSLVESLRIQSDMMRFKRIQRAEELAAKIPVKILLPLILFIFPTLMIVLIGPAVIQMSKSLFQ